MCLSAGALQESRGCSLYEHTAVCVFLTDWQLATAELLSDLVTVDADWHRLNLLTDWLTVDTQVLKHKHIFETDSDRGHPVHPYYTTYKQYTSGSACCVYQWLTKRSQSHQQMLGRSRRRNAFSEIFKKQPDGNMMNITKMTLSTLLAANWKLSMIVPIFWSCQELTSDETIAVVFLERVTNGLPARAPRTAHQPWSVRQLMGVPELYEKRAIHQSWAVPDSCNSYCSQQWNTLQILQRLWEIWEVLLDALWPNAHHLALLATTRALKQTGLSGNQSNTLQSPSNILHTPSDILLTVSKVLCFLSKILHTLSKILCTLSKILCIQPHTQVGLQLYLANMFKAMKASSR